MGMQYRLHFLGINPLNGEYIYEDYNKNGRIDVNPAVLPGTKDDDRYVMIDYESCIPGKLFSGVRMERFQLLDGVQFQSWEKRSSNPEYIPQEL